MKSANEADGDDAIQPRSFFDVTDNPQSQIGNKPSRGFWVVLTVMLMLLTAVVVVSVSPEVHDVPPPMQSFVRPKQTPSVPVTAPPTTKEPEPLVRVNVTPGGVDSFQLETRGPYELKSLDARDKGPLTIPSGRHVISSTKNGLKIGKQQFGSSRLEIVPERSPSIRINGHLYRGMIRLYRRTDGKVSAVNVLPLEEYLASVVDSEMPAAFPEAARQAQAIVARTYALYHIQQADPNAVFDLLSSQRSQKYLGVEYIDSAGRRLAGESDSSRKAVRATRGIVCRRHNKLFCTYYSAVCGGQTTHGHEVFKDAIDVVKSVSCDWCRDSPHYRWTTELTRTDFQHLAFGRNQRNSGVVRSIRQSVEPGSGRVSQFELHDGQHERPVNGIELRERLPQGTLFSPHFQIKLEKTRVVFEGRGHGHGVGFCQWGAKGQAEAGRNSFDIVRYYYPGAELATLNYGF